MGLGPAGRTAFFSRSIIRQERLFLLSPIKFNYRNPRAKLSNRRRKSAPSLPRDDRREVQNFRRKTKSRLDRLPTEKFRRRTYERKGETASEIPTDRTNEQGRLPRVTETPSAGKAGLASPGRGEGAPSSSPKT